MPNEVIFADVPVGRQFIAPSGVRYKKISKIAAKAMVDANGKTIINGDTTVKFYQTSMILKFYTG